MRIDHGEQRFGDLWEFVLLFEMNARGQEGERFEKPLHMGVFALGRLKDKPRRYLGMLFGEQRS